MTDFPGAPLNDKGEPLTMNSRWRDHRWFSFLDCEALPVWNLGLDAAGNTVVLYREWGMLAVDLTLGLEQKETTLVVNDFYHKNKKRPRIWRTRNVYQNHGEAVEAARLEATLLSLAGDDQTA